MDNPTSNCDVDTGMCTVPQGANDDSQPHGVSFPAEGARQGKRTNIILATDPICSACWVMEPAWRSVALRYGDLIDTQLVYGGLLPGWEGFHDARAGIHGPQDVAHHWDDFSRTFGQPIDSSVWHTDPIPSSYPPSIAAVAVRLVAPHREEAYLRRLRELLFLDGRNIARREIQVEAAEAVGVDSVALETALTDGRADALFQADLRLTRRLGVRGFPTIIVTGPHDRVTLHGALSLDRLERAVLAASGAEHRAPHNDVEGVLAALGVGTTAEYAAALGKSPEEAEAILRAAGVPNRAVGAGTVWMP